MNTLAHDMALARGKRYVIDFDTGCWNWFGPKDRMGYAGMTGGHVHRMFYIDRYGPTTATLDHLCRNRGCVNPDHLDPTTRGENVRRGANSKLNWDLVTYIRESPLRNKDLADELGVSAPTICNVRAGRNWAEKDRP